MNCTIGVLQETLSYETRVALAPEGVAKLIKQGFKVLVEEGAGKKASFDDAQYLEAGASVVKAEQLLDGSKLILSINPLRDELIPLLTAQHIVIGNYGALYNAELVNKLAATGAELLSLELMPRISRAQSMDILSSQNNLAGYASILEATNYYSRLLPLMMTSAGMIAPARVFVMGIGVAGLQAIATAKRLGAIVTAYDVRAATKEQAESLGAKFLVVDESIFADSETVGGYAKELPEDYKAKEREALLKHITTQDIVITTALIPGKKAPLLIDEDMLALMKPGSVIVDLAASGGGNTTLTKCEEIVEARGVTVVGKANLACNVPSTASTLFGNNIINLLSLRNKEAENFSFDYSDEIIKSILVTQNKAVLLGSTNR